MAILHFLFRSHQLYFMMWRPLLLFVLCTVLSANLAYGQKKDKPPKRVAVVNDSLLEKFAEPPTIILFDQQLEGDDNNNSLESTSPLLQASRDVFARSASFDWGMYFFNPRGYNSRHAKVLMNGIEMNHPLNGRPIWRDWGGLNTIMRYPQFEYGIEPYTAHHGSLASTSDFDTRASSIRSQKSITASYTSRNNYQYRLLGTYATGLSVKGWAFAISAGARLGDKPIASSGRSGGFLRSYSLFTSLSKKWEKHSLHLSLIAVYDQRGLSSNPMTQETKDLFGIHYNPYWGYQNGKVRNSRVRDNFAPIMQLMHEWNPSTSSSLKTTLSVQTAYRARSRMARFNQPSTNPVYYKYLPSYALSQGNDPQSANVYTQNYLLPTSGSEINWQYIYATNQALSSQGLPPGYVLAADVEESNRYAAKTTYSHKFSESFLLYTTLAFQVNVIETYRKAKDLLNGLPFQDIDPFNNTRNNLYSTALVVKGGRYDYSATLFQDYFYWNVLGRFSKGKLSGDIGFNLSTTSIWREGHFNNEIYGLTSYGKSDVLSFLNYSAKLATTYAVGGPHYIKLNAMYGTEAPTVQEAIPNSRYQNTLLPNIQSVEIISGDLSYLFRNPVFDIRATFFYTERRNQVDVSYFFVQANAFDAFTAEVASGINSRSLGGEFGMKVSLSSSLTLTVAAAYGEYRYTNNPKLILLGADLQEIAGVLENSQDVETLTLGEALLKNYRLSNGPQTALNVGLQYVSSTYWRLGISANYLANNYISVANIQRTSLFSENPVTKVTYSGYSEELARRLLKQEQFPSAFYINVNVGKSWRWKHYFISLFLNVSNALNSTNIITGGYEQSRYASFQLAQEDAGRATSLFGNRYWYAQGINFFLNFSFRF